MLNAADNVTARPSVPAPSKTQQERAEAALAAGDPKSLEDVLVAASEADYRKLWYNWADKDFKRVTPDSEATMDVLLRHTPDAVLQDANNDTLICALRGAATPGIVQKLLERGCKAPYLGVGWLAYRTDPTHVEALVELMLNHGANRQKLSVARLLTYLASFHGSAETALAFQHALLKRGCDPNEIDTITGDPFLYKLTTCGWARPDYAAAAIRQAAAFGADPNCCDQNGKTPLDLAIALDRPQVIKALLDAGADLKRTGYGEFPDALALAAAASSPKSIITLRATGLYGKQRLQRALKFERKHHSSETREALRRPEDQLNIEGSGRTWLFSAIKDRWRRVGARLQRRYRQKR